MSSFLSDAVHIFADHCRAFPHRLGHGQAESFSDRFLEHDGVALQGVYEHRVLNTQNYDYQTSRETIARMSVGKLGTSRRTENTTSPCRPGRVSGLMIVQVALRREGANHGEWP